MVHSALEQLVDAYLDPLQVDEVVNQFAVTEQTAARRMILHLVHSHVYLAIFSSLSTIELRQFWQLLNKPALNYEDLQTWLDNHISECRLLLAESTQKALYTIGSTLSVNRHVTN